MFKTYLKHAPWLHTEMFIAIEDFCVNDAQCVWQHSEVINPPNRIQNETETRVQTAYEFSPAAHFSRLEHWAKKLKSAQKRQTGRGTFAAIASDGVRQWITLQ